MEPGSIETLFLDDSAAFRAEFEGAIPQPSDLYWRGPVLWNFNGQSWTGSFYGSNIEAKALPELADSPWRYTVQLEPNERRWLFALDYPSIVPDKARISMDFQILKRQPVIQLLQYSMASNPDFIDMPKLPETLRGIALDLPQRNNPRTRELIEEWREQTPGDAALVRRILDHFNQEEFHYSLQAPLLGEHSVDEFLFDTRTGYCEHYASAFTVMMRMAGIPARVVTGYQGGWYNEIGNYMLIRQSDAHAWSEIWLPRSGWTRIDPTAAVSPLRVAEGSLGALSAPRHMFDYEWLRNLRNGFDLVQQRWNDWVIKFGARSQARMFSSIGLDHMSPAVLVSVMFVAMGVFSLVLLPFIFGVRGPGRRDPVQVAWQRFLKRLKSAGFEAPPSTGAIELAEAAALQLPEHAPSIKRIASLYSRSRYSAEPPTLLELKTAVTKFRPKNGAA
jgi:transglutaminase-like putative cysteine protease